MNGEINIDEDEECHRRVGMLVHALAVCKAALIDVCVPPCALVMTLRLFEDGCILKQACARVCVCVCVCVCSCACLAHQVRDASILWKARQALEH